MRNIFLVYITFFLFSLLLLQCCSTDTDFRDVVYTNDFAPVMSALEDEFKVTLETDDIIDFSSYKKGIELLGSKYEVKF